jgi:hypothetical protein
MTRRRTARRRAGAGARLYLPHLVADDGDGTPASTSPPPTPSVSAPPGNPLFVIIGRVFSILPIAPNVAMRINVLAAVSSAVAAAMWYLVARRIAVRAGLGIATSRIAAGLSTLMVPRRLRRGTSRW